MTYIIPSLIAAVIIWVFARRLNKFENEEVSLAMNSVATEPEAPMGNGGEAPQEDPGPTTTPPQAEGEATEGEGTETSQSAEEEDQNTPRTIDLVADLLRQMGCQPEKHEEDGLLVKYQGESFLIGANGVVVTFYDLPWGHFNIHDPKAETFREAVNKANFNTLPTILMQSPDEEGNVSILSRYQTMVHASCPINDQWLGFILDSFFVAQRQLKEDHQELLAAQQQPKDPVRKNRRPVGFATQDPTDE